MDRPAPLIVAARPHPFRLERRVVEIPHGPTIAEILAIAVPDDIARRHAVVTLDGEPIEQSTWPSIVPPPGARLTIAIRPGSADFLRPLLLLGVVITAAAVGPLIAGPGLGLTAGTLGYSLTAAAISVAITAIGTLAVNALVPPPQPDLGRPRRAAKTWSLEAASNEPRLYGSVPRVLGRHRYAPPLAADVIPEGDGTASAIRIAVCWGYGPILLSDLKFGETPLDQIPDVEVEHHLGAPGQIPALDLYSRDVSVERVDAAVTYDGGPVVRRSAPNPRQIVVQLVWPRGLFSLEKDGTRDALRVAYRIEIAPVGGAWTTVIEREELQKVTSPFRREHVIDVTAQVDVRVTRLTRDRRDAAKVDQLVWATLSTIQADNPFALPGVAISAFRIPAGEQTQGTLQPINAIVESIVPDWDGSGWIQRATRNPASLARAVLQGPGNPRPIPDERLDLAAFADWHQYCQQRGLTCDLVVDWDGATVGEVLQIVAAAGHAIVVPIDGRWTPVIDRPQQIPVQLISPRTAAEIRATRILAPELHGLRVRFIDGAAGYRRAERVVYADGWSAATATRLEDFDLVGVTDPDLVYRHARRRLAELVLRAERFVFRLGWEHLAIRLGDRIEIASDTLLSATGWGRIVDLGTDETGAVTALILDQAVPLGAGVQYGAAIRRPTGIQTVPLAVLAAARESSELALDPPLPSNQAPAIGDLVVVGEAGRVAQPALVTRIRPADDLAAIVEAVAYHDGVYSADTEPIPPWEPVIQGAVQPPIIRTVDRDPATGELLVWLAVRSGREAVAAIEIRVVENIAGAIPIITSWSPDTALARLQNIPDATVAIAARSRLITGVVSAWSADIIVQPPTVDPPPPVEGLVVDGDEVIWRASPVPWVVGYKIRYGQSGVAWQDALPAHDGLIVETRWSARQLPVTETELLVVAVGPSGSISEPRRVRWARRDELQDYIPIALTDYAELGWPGEIVDGERGEDGVHGRGSLAAFSVPPDPAFPEPNSPAFPGERRSTPWTWTVEWTVPTTATIRDVELQITPADVILVRAGLDPAAGGRIHEIALARPGEVVGEPWADGRYWSDGRGWIRENRIPWITWPRLIRATPGATVRVRVIGTGLLRAFVLGVARQRRVSVQSNVAVALAGTTLPLPTDVQVVTAAIATPAEPNAIVRATPVTGGVLVTATDLDGDPIATTATVLMEGV